jgi:hypothetical protein
MEKIYIQKDRVITGPYAINQLQQQRLRSSDKVWYEGLSEWKTAQQVDFLRRYISSAQRHGFFSRFLGVR